MVAATVAEADRLWDEWRAFDAREGPNRMIPRAAFEEFGALVEGIGERGRGILEEIISDCSMSIRGAAPNEPNDGTIATMALGADRERRVRRLFPAMKKANGGQWDSGEALRWLRAFERRFAIRKREFLRNHPVYEPVDEELWAGLAWKVEQLIPTPGDRWKWDAKILGQSGAFVGERREATTFVSNDRAHMKNKKAAICSITGLQDIVALDGTPL
jgi:hypothetical protein